LSGLLARLLVPGLFGAEIVDVGQSVEIHPEEEIHVARAGPVRRRDFALGRFCARAALSPLGFGQAEIPKAESGAPIWPPGLLGSITHTQGYAAALAGRAREFICIGVDAERVGGIGEELWPRLFLGAEREQLSAAKNSPLNATLLFSAKEACYKAWQLKAVPDFRDIHIALQKESFVAIHAGQTLKGCHVAEDDLVLTMAFARR
jgi:4'-phosphopantetheinyl transferase EntD